MALSDDVKKTGTVKEKLSDPLQKLRGQTLIQLLKVDIELANKSAIKLARSPVFMNILFPVLEREKTDSRHFSFKPVD